jgi:hypothetical protein
MADYLYHTYVYKNTNDVLGVVPADEAANTLDFETNYKATAVKVDDLEIMGTTFETIKTYSQLKALVDGVTITWADVKFAVEGKAYDIYLLTSDPL